MTKARAEELRREIVTELLLEHQAKMLEREIATMGAKGVPEAEIQQHKAAFAEYYRIVAEFSGLTPEQKDHKAFTEAVSSCAWVKVHEVDVPGLLAESARLEAAMDDLDLVRVDILPESIDKRKKRRNVF